MQRLYCALSWPRLAHKRLATNSTGETMMVNTMRLAEQVSFAMR